MPRARWTIRRIWVSFCGDSCVRYMSSELERSAGTEDWTSHAPGKDGVVSIYSAGYAAVEVGGCVFESPCWESGNALSMRREQRRSKRMGGWSSAPQRNGEKRRRGERLVRSSSVHARKHADGAEAPPTSRKHWSQPGCRPRPDTRAPPHSTAPPKRLQVLAPLGSSHPIPLA
jgi:hypothetical protein